MFRKGMELAGHECIGYVEIDDQARKTYEANYDVKDEWTKWDVTEIKADEIPIADIWCFGFPCKNMSTANAVTRTGLDGEQSGLFLTMCNLLSNSKTKPRYLFIENVQGFTTINKGLDFLKALCKLVDPILKYIPKDKTIWCPFDEEWSAYYNLFKDKGYKTIRSSIQEGQDFFTYEPEDYDIIVSNPPFNIKDNILKRLDKLGKPFAILLPLNSLQGASRYRYCFKNGIQLLAFDQRIGFHKVDKMDIPVEGSLFASAYFCRNILPKDLIVEELHKYDKPLIDKNNTIEQIFYVKN